MKVIIRNKKKKIILKVKKVSFFGKFIGLMFKNSRTDNLMFDFSYLNKHAIHSFFVFFDFLAVWLDYKNNVLGYEIIKPFRSLVKPRFNFIRLIEIPLNKKNKKILSFFVEKRKV